MAAAGTIAAAVYNSQRSSESDPFATPSDFMPRSLEELRREALELKDEPELTIEELSSFFGAIKQNEPKA